MENKKILINEEEAEVVRYIFNEYAKCLSVREIINSLRAKGVLFRGKEFASSTIYVMLRNEKYTGAYYHDDELVDNMYPQIISKDLFDSIRRMSVFNRNNRKSTQVKYILRHKLVCGYCGMPITAECGTSSTQEVMRYYKCSGKKRMHRECEKEQVRKEILEELVLNAVLDELSEPAMQRKIVKQLLAIQEAETEVNPVVGILERQQKQIARSIENLMNAIEQGIVAGTTGKRLRELEEQQIDVERQLLVERAKEIVKLTEQDMLTYYRRALEAEPEVLINYLIKEVVLFNDRMDIYFNSPITNSPDGQHQGFLIYTGHRHARQVPGGVYTHTVGINIYVG